MNQLMMVPQTRYPSTAMEIPIYDSHPAGAHDVGSFHPSTAAHNLLFTARVRSDIDTDRLERSLQKLFDRRPALRTTDHFGGGSSIQRAHRLQEVRLTCVDATFWSDEELREIVHLTSRQSFDLSDLVMRAALFSRSDNDQLLLVMVHHVAVDRWGQGVILRELNALCCGETLAAIAGDTAPGFVDDAGGHFLAERHNRACEVTYPGGVHRLIEEQVARTPHRVALNLGTVRLTYLELDRRANRLARQLRASGVDPRSRVAICLERSSDSVIALLAVLKAGAACVTLDPIDTASRLIAVLEQARVAAVIVRGPLAGKPLPLGARVVDLIALEHTLESISGEPLGISADPENPACVTFTARAGQLPGVATMTHGAVIGLLRSHMHERGNRPIERPSMPAPGSADPCLLELLLPLAAGEEIDLPHLAAPKP